MYNKMMEMLARPFKKSKVLSMLLVIICFILVIKAYTLLELDFFTGIF